MKRLLITSFKRNYYALLLCTGLFFICTAINAQTWAFRGGYGGATADKGSATCTDVSGNVYIAGTYVTTVNFGGGALASAGLNEGFVAKFNASGVYQWAIRFGATLNDAATAMTTDGTSVYVTGTFTGAMTVGSSATTYASSGSTDGFLIKLDAATGGTTWVKTFGGTSVEMTQAICLDPTGNIYITGNFFSSPATFGTFTRTPSSGTSDLFVTQVSSAGVFNWVNSGGGSGNDNPVGSGICYVPALGEVVVTGGTNNGGATTCVYGGVSIPVAGNGNDIILLEINATTGAFISGIGVGAAVTNEDGLAACYDSHTGDVFISGYFSSSSITFPGDPAITNAGSADDMFYARYNPSTNAFTWSKSAGSSGPGSDRARGICSNGTGGIFLTGVFGVGTASFPGSPAATITNSRTNGAEPFITKVSPANGNVVFAVNGVADNTTATDHAGNAIACSTTGSGAVWITGSYTTNLTLGALSPLAASGSTDVLLAKLTDPVPITLPVTWLSFSVKRKDRSALLNWSTAAELNTRDFAVEHSINGTSWNTLSILPASGNSGSSRTYTYTDDHATKGNNYYRIMQSDLDGKTSYSEVRVINLAGDNAAFIIPGNTISNGVLQVQVYQTTVISFFDVGGKLLWKRQFAPGSQSLDVSSFSKGVYFLKGDRKTERIVIQ